MNKVREKKIIGRLESINLPELHIENMQVKVDTGAKTSSLHVDNITRMMRGGRPWISFDIHPDVHNVSHIVKCEAPVADIRNVKSSNGKSEQRYVIETKVELGPSSWQIEITLTDRSDMSYLMLFGREALGKRFLVDPSKVFLSSEQGS